MKVDKICLCFLMFFVAGLNSLAIAQRQYGGGGYMIAGYSILSRPGGAPGELPMPGGMLIGGGGFGYLNRFVIGGTGFGLLGRTFKVDGNEAQNRLTFGGGGFEFGYDVAKRKDILLNTNILIGGLGAEYQIEKDVSSIVYSHGSLIMGLSFQYLRFIIGGLDELGNGGGMMVGVKLSAWSSLRSNMWKEANGTTFSGWSSYAPVCVSLGVTLGGAGF